jgi:hypothetical protein
MKLALASLVMLAMLSLSTPALAQKNVAPIAVGPNASLITNTYQSVVLLYSEDPEGGMHFHCTATAYRKTDKGYRFVSAGHCVSGSRDVDQKEQKFFVSNDASTKSFIPVKLIQVGDKDRGDDFSIWEAETKEVFVVTPLGDNDKILMGSEVIDIASPLGLGKQYFVGYVSSPHVDRPPLDAGEVKWHDVMLVMIGSGPGSSGSAIVSVDQKSIVGFLVGGTPANIGAIVVPVNSFKTFESLVDAGKYKKTPVSSESLRGLLPFNAQSADQRSKRGQGDRKGNITNRDRNRGGDRNNHQDRRPSRVGREHRGRIHDRDIRYEHGRRDFRWGGVWFTCSIYPSWVWAGDVYIVNINGEWFIVSYNDPRLMWQVIIVD